MLRCSTAPLLPTCSVPRRNFIALKEGLENTWLNTVASLVRRYSADGASPLTSAELAGVPGGERYVLALYFSAVTIATLGYGEPRVVMHVVGGGVEGKN